MMSQMFQVGVEVFKRLTITVLVVDADSHAQVLVVFGSDLFDDLKDSYLDCLVAVRVVRLFVPFVRLEGGVLLPLFFISIDSIEASVSCDLAL